MQEFNPFVACYRSLYLKYIVLNDVINDSTNIEKYDRLNVFISMESVLKKLTSSQGRFEEFEAKYRNYATLLTSGMINLLGFYKSYFSRGPYDVRVYLYYTDILSDYFPQFKYNDDYRGYYLEKYNSNPYFANVMDAFRETVFSEAKTIAEFVPGCYILSAHNIEGSLIPMIVAEDDTSRKNLVITIDPYDTQFMDIPNFNTIYISRWFQNCKVIGNSIEFMSHQTKKDIETVKNTMGFIQNYSMLCSILSVLGSKERGIESISGYGALTFKNALDKAILQNKLDYTTTNPELIGEIFDDEYLKEEYLKNFKCTCLYRMFEELTDADKKSILNQRVDRIDRNAIEDLNDNKFIECPIEINQLF